MFSNGLKKKKKRSFSDASYDTFLLVSSKITCTLQMSQHLKKKKKLHDVTSSTGLKKSCTVQIINAPNIDYK